jgi:glyoxylase-like metal-dependent hydrolase (beta-lactamase superfamily II)
VAALEAPALHAVSRDAKIQPASALASGLTMGLTMLRRRHLVVCCCGAVMGCAAPRASADRIALQTVAPGVFFARGATGEVSPTNLGRVGNAGFIEGPQGVLAIDTGTSFAHGQALMQALREKTSAPVRRALNTRQEFLFGAPAFQAARTPVHMHPAAATLMVSRCERCLKTLQQTLGTQAMQGTAMFKPDGLLDDTATQDISVIGRRLQVLHFGHSSGPGDVAVLDETTGSLFAGGLVDDRRIPDIQDSRLPEWEAALSSLSKLPIRHIMPGHGPAGGPELIGGVQRYLGQLQARVRALIQSGVGLGDAVEQLESDDAFRDWAGYDIIHRRNVSIAYLRQEQALLFNR